MESIFLIIAIVLLCIGILGVSIFAVKNIIAGKHNVQQIVIYLLPVVIVGIMFLIYGEPIDAGIASMLLMLTLMLLGIAITGIRSSFKI